MRTTAQTADTSGTLFGTSSKLSRPGDNMHGRGDNASIDESLVRDEKRKKLDEMRNEEDEMYVYVRINNK